MLKVKYKLFEEKYYLPGLYETNILQATNDKGYGNGGLYGDYNFVNKSVEWSDECKPKLGKGTRPYASRGIFEDENKVINTKI